MRQDYEVSAPISILCVDCDRDTTSMASTSLCARYPNVVVHCAENGAEGLRMYKQHLPKIIITEIDLPAMDGLTMAAEIASLDPEAIIIAVTAVSESSTLLKAIDLGIGKYLLKPLDLMALFKYTDQYLSKITLKRQTRAQNRRIRKLSEAVEQTPASVIIMNAEGIIEHVNARFTDISGYTPGEVIGHDIGMLMSESGPRDAFEDSWRTISSGNIWRGELQRIKKTGERYWVSVAVSPVYNEDGTTHYISVSEDITERKAADQERESTIEFLRIVNASTGIEEMLSRAMLFFKHRSACSSVGIRLRDREDYPYHATLGLSAEFIQAENSLCVTGPDGEIIRDGNGNPILACMCGKVLAGRCPPGEPFFTPQGSFWTNSTTELRATTCEAQRHGLTRNRCNREGYESVALIPLVVGQERVGLLQLNDQRKGAFCTQEIKVWERIAGYLALALAKFRDEALLQKLNEDLDKQVQERTFRLELALREQESFSYSVSHDLRAPLRHVNSYLGILSEDFGDALPSEAHSFLDRARAASRQMGELIDHLLELSRISRTPLAKSPVNLSEISSRICENLKETEPDRLVEFVISPDITAECDQTLVRQVLENLLENAWKYTSKNRVGRIEFGKKVHDDQEVIFVRDNGVGFDPAYMDKLFIPFERLHGPEYQGNGIGLATVQRIIERHGGKVWAESEEQKGATFCFSL